MPRKLPNPWHLSIILLAFAFWLIPRAVGYLPESTDWEPIFWPAIKAVTHGESPYRVPLATHPIHLYLLLGWAGLLTAHASLVLWMGATLAILTISAWHLTDRGWPALLAILFCPLLLHLVRTGNATALEVGGMALLLVGLQRESVTLVLLSVVPLSAVPPNTLPLLAWGLLRRRYFLPGLGALVLLLLGTVALYGNWIPSWLGAMAATSDLMKRDYYMDLWGWGWPVMLPTLTIMVGATYHYRETFFRLDLQAQALFVLSSTYMVTPYLLNYRIIPLYVLTVAVLSRREKYLPLVLMALGYVCLITSLQPGHLYEVVWIVPFSYVVALLELHRATQLPQEEKRESIYV